MSIQKNTPNILRRVALPFTSIFNSTMDLIVNPAALGIYCYLASKPDTWIIRDVELQRRFDCGRDFIRARMAELKRAGLIKLQAIRDEKGQVTRWETTLINQVTENPSSGQDAIINDSEMHDIQITENPECGKPRCLDNPTHINKRDLQIKEVLEIKERSIAVSSKTARKKVKEYKADDRFMIFYNAFPKKKQPHKAWKAFQAVIGDDEELFLKLVTHVALSRREDKQWRDPQFIPYPASYINSRDFESLIGPGEYLQVATREEAIAEADKIRDKVYAMQDAKAEKERNKAVPPVVRQVSKNARTGIQSMKDILRGALG